MTLYSSNPAVARNGSTADGPISLGVEFKVTASSCTLNGFRFYQGGAPWTGTVTAALYAVGGTTPLTTAVTVSTAASLPAAPTAAASSEPAGSGFGAAQAIDSDPSTRWLGTAPTVAAPQWLRITYAQSQVVTGYSITGHPSSNAYSPTAWKFQGSNDGTSWTDLDTRSGVTWGAVGVAQSFSFANSAGFTQYRILITANNGATDFVSIAEFPLSGIVDPAWREVTLSSPFPLAVGTNYRAVFFFPTTRPSFFGALNSTLTSGPLTVPGTNVSSNGNHTFAYGAAMQNPLSSGASNYMIDVIVEQGGAPVTTTGTVAGTLPSLTGATSGTVTAPVTGAVAGTLPSLTGAATGTPVTTGASNGTLPPLTGSASGTVAGLTTGTVDGTLPALSGAATGAVTGPTTGTVAGTLPALTGTVTDSTVGTSIAVGVTVETGALTLLRLKALPGVEVHIGLGVTAGEAQAVVPLPGVSIEIGCSLIARPISVRAVDARGRRPQWRYVVTDLANQPLGELVDLEHDPVEDGVGDPATMSFTVATASADNALIRPVERQCQVWDGDVLRLRGPILPGRPSDDGTAVTYTVHDPSWFWRDGRRLIARIPQKNLLHNGDFKNDLAYWTPGYDRESKPAAAPKVRVVSEDFADDTDGLNPIKAAEIVGVESVTESELSSNAVFWPNLATFRPGGVASVEAVANAMPTTAGLKVTVVGHTANDGTGNGLKLSERRAVAAAAIIKKKRPGAVITTKGVGFYDPKRGFPINSQAQRRVVIQYDQTISGESLQWMRQRVEVTQPKEARYPLVLTAAAMLKVADDWSIEDANMMSVKVLARRKTGAKPPKSVADALAAAKVDYQSALTHLAEVTADKNHTADQLDSARADVATAQTKVSDAQNEADSAPWDLQLGVGSASISDTDPVDRWIPQTAEATIPADGRVYVVDVYLYAPAALARYTAVGLFPEEMLYFWGQDQASIFAGIMEHIQDPAFGHGDLGVGTRTPLTGVLRDREFAFRDLTPADTALDGLTAISRGLEWDTVTTPTATTATTYYPRQGKTVDYVLAQGGNVAVAVPANTRDIGSNVIAQAQGLGSYRAVAYARDARAFGGTLLERVVTAEQDTPLNELRETATAELHWARSSTPAYWVDIDPESMEDVLANTAKGDTVRLILDYPTPVDALARIVRRQIHPDSLRLMVAFEEA